MAWFFLNRFLQALAVLLVMSLVIYSLIGLMPGDPVDLMITTDPQFTTADAAHLRELYGLDKTILERYINWLIAALSGDFGFSRLYARPVFLVMQEALFNTVILLGLSFFLALAIGLPMGILAAATANSKWDYCLNLMAFGGISVPPFWLALMLIICFSVILGWLPSGGTPAASGAEGVWAETRYLILPVISLAITNLGSHARYMRAAILEALRQDYIRTAHAKGLPESRIILGHALRNALIPVVTIIALDFGYLFSGALITETIFSYPGMGKLIFDAIMGNDFNLALIALLFATALTIFANFLADSAYVLLDKRVSYSETLK